MDSLAHLLDSYSDALAPLREAACRYLKYPSVLAKDGVMNIGHRPWVAELNYMFMLYPAIDRDSLERYSQRFRIEIPTMYARVLSELNGAFCFGMSLCGVPISMLGNPPLLYRTVLQCHDLATAATMWASEYRVPSNFFHFGGRHFSSSANVGYFIEGDSRILCAKKSGKIICEWTSFAEFLADELKTSEELEEKRRPWR
jgi:hypothetical protein